MSESEISAVDLALFMGESDKEAEAAPAPTCQLPNFSNNFSAKKIGSIAKYIEPVQGSNTIDTLVPLFQQNPDLEVVPVEEYDHVTGVIDRKTVINATNTFWKRFTAKYISNYMENITIVLYADDFIEQTLPKIYEINMLYGIVYFPVFYKTSFYGIVSLHEFLSRLADIRDQDLKNASLTQNFLFPDATTLNTLPYTVTTWNRMANILGGDAYQVFKMNENETIVGCFDVSGKNVAASLLTVTVASFFKALKFITKNIETPQKIVAMLDSYLETVVPRGSFITGVLCFVDVKRNFIYIFNCGHTSIFLLYKDSASKSPRIIAVDPKLPPFGIGGVKSDLAAAYDPKNRPFELLKAKPGIHIDLYTDGFSDMQGDDAVRFEDENVKRFFTELYDTPENQVYDTITKTVDSYIGHSMIPDDITVIDIRL
ncbi:MAG: PP2C family protein-serine/threonine phosphatase [Treponema sp.]